MSFNTMNTTRILTIFLITTAASVAFAIAYLSPITQVAAKRTADGCPNGQIPTQDQKDTAGTTFDCQKFGVNHLNESFHNATFPK